MSIGVACFIELLEEESIGDGELVWLANGAVNGSLVTPDAGTEFGDG